MTRKLARVEEGVGVGAVAEVGVVGVVVEVVEGAVGVERRG